MSWEGPRHEASCPRAVAPRLTPYPPPPAPACSYASPAGEAHSALTVQSFYWDFVPQARQIEFSHMTNDSVSSPLISLEVGRSSGYYYVAQSPNLPTKRLVFPAWQDPILKLPGGHHESLVSINQYVVSWAHRE